MKGGAETEWASWPNSSEYGDQQLASTTILSLQLLFGLAIVLVKFCMIWRKHEWVYRKASPDKVKLFSSIHYIITNAGLLGRR